MQKAIKLTIKPQECSEYSSHCQEESRQMAVQMTPHTKWGASSEEHTRKTLYMATSGSVNIYLICISQIPGMALNINLHPDSFQVWMEPGNSKASLTMENIILKAGHYSAGPSVGETPSQMFSDPQLHTQNNLPYLEHFMLFSCNFVYKAQDPLLSWRKKTKQNKTHHQKPNTTNTDQS